MKILLSVLLSMLLVFSIGCGNEENSGDQETQEQQTQNEVKIPKVDLHSAVVTNNIEVIKQHIAAGSDIDVLEPSKESTPLISAAFMGNAEIVKLLLDAGADVNYYNVDGANALHTAAAFGKTDVSKILIDAGIDLNAQKNDGSTALHVATFFCREDIVELLLKSGADKSFKNNNELTPYEMTTIPFDDLLPVYQAVENSLKPLGMKLDYERIKKTRPKIAEMLK